jgi:myo-inositol-1(or 4)-monophosphatase
VHAARAAGEQAPDTDTKSTATDLVTEIDRASERWLVERLAELRPDDDVLGEEGAGHGGRTGDRVRWVVDPIDGTVNFVLGLPDYAVSVAAEVEGTVVAGAVCNPSSGETFHARVGGGAFLLRADRPELPLRGPRDVPLARAVVATGFAYDAPTRARQIAVVTDLLPRIADIRRIGAASLDLCNVAAGRVDAYFEAGLNLWDFAAGALVAREAGCVVTGLAGRPESEQFLAAAGPGLADDLERVLRELGADGVR